MDRRNEVLAALREADAPLSGERLAARLGVSRAAVAKHVRALREAGYDISASPGTGYALHDVPDAPLPAEVAERVTSTRWVRFEGGGPTRSTNDDARELARRGAPEGTVVLASAQTAGRGRMGRTWASPEGGVYLSAVLRPPSGPAEAAALSPALSLGVAFGLERLGASVALKWPNDVWVGQGKTVGLLLEMAAEQDRVSWLVVGCGIDVRRPPTGAPAEASYIDDVLDPTPKAYEVAAKVLDGMDEAYGRYLAGGFAALRGEYGSRSLLDGREVRVCDSAGRVVARGRVSSVDESGRLVVDTADGPVALAAGDVTLARDGPGWGGPET